MDKNYVKTLLDYLEKILECEFKLVDAKDCLEKYSENVLKLGIPRHIPTPEVPNNPQSTYRFKLFNKMGSYSALGSIGCGIIGAILGNFGEGALMGIFLGISSAIIMETTSYILAERKYQSTYEEILFDYNRQIEMYNEMQQEEQKRLIQENEDKISCEYEIEELKKLIIKTEENLSSLYGMNILHKRYQNVIAVISVLSDLSAGLTYSLELDGYDQGAYNKYEQKILAGTVAKIVVNAIEKTGDSIVKSINNLATSINSNQQHYFDALSNSYQVQLELADKLQGIQNGQTRNNLLQEEILKQERLQTEVQSSGFYKRLYNKDGYIVK